MVPGQPGLHNEILSLGEKKKIQHSGGKGKKISVNSRPGYVMSHCLETTAINFPKCNSIEDHHALNIKLQ